MAEITEQFAPSTPIDTSRSGIDADKRHEACPEDIVLSAYFRSEAKGFAAGGEMEDWFAADAGSWPMAQMKLAQIGVDVWQLERSLDDGKTNLGNGPRA